MTGHFPRLRLYSSQSGQQRLVRREVVRLCLYLPFDHHELANGVRRSLDAYLHAAGEGPEVLSEWWHAEGEAFPLDEYGWEQLRAQLSPPRKGRWFLEDLEDERDIHRYLKRQCERSVSLTGGDSGISGYGFFYQSRLPWRTRTRVEEELSLVSFSWPTEYLAEHGPGRVRELAMELASLLPFSTGHAGLALQLPDETTSHWNREELFRYPGIDVPHGLTSIGPRVDGVHWLNFLGPPVLGEVGGAAGLRARLYSPGTTVQELEGERAVVTLGQWPEAGDLSRGLGLPEYRELARVLEPWLFPCPSHESWPGASHEETRRWWRRFLD